MYFNIWNTKIKFNESDYTIELNWKKIKPDIRTYAQMKDLYLEKEKLSDDAPLYLMYRWVYLNEQDKKLFEDYDLRYDITIILPKIIWKEYNKTFWHYHPKTPKWFFYEELYQVLHWEAIYLQQNNKKTFYTKAKSKDAVLMKASFWHVTINPSKDDILVMANIVSSKFSSIYDDYKAKKWARYYLTTNGWVKNLNYKDDIDLEQLNDKFNLENDLYLDFITNPKKFNFLHLNMPKIKKCIIPAAGSGTRFLPATKALPKEMFPIVNKPVMQLLVEEALSVWCEEIIIITWRNKRAIEDHFDANIELEKKLEESGKLDYLEEVKKLNSMANFVYVRQPYPLWDGDAILRAKNLIGDEPFLVLFWDDIVDGSVTASEQLLEAFNRKNSSVIATVQVPEDEVKNYWIIETSWNDDVFVVEKFLEKPFKEETSSRNAVIWKYILTADIFDYLEKAKYNKISKDGELRLADALELMRKNKDIYWVKISGKRFDTGNKLGYVQAVIHYALKDKDIAEQLKDYLKTLKL